VSRIRVEPFIDDPEAIRAITEYWAQDDDLAFTHKVGAVAAVLGIRARDVVRLVTQFSRAYVPEWPCGACDGIRPLASRAEYTQARSGRLAWYCHGCLERFAAEADVARRAEVEKYYPGIASPSRPPGLIDGVLLLSLARIEGSGSQGSVGPLTGANPPLSPTAYEDYQILARLHERGHIAVDPTSDPTAFEWDEYGRPERFDPLRIRWRLADFPLASAEAPRVRREVLADASEGDHAALLRLCRTVLVQECFQFLELVLDRNQLSFFPGRGTRELFERLVEDFSVAQVYNLIWRSARGAVEYAGKAAITPEHAGATVVHEISRKAEYALATATELKPYRRDRGAPRSRLGEIVFDLLLEIGEDAAFLTPWRALQDVVSQRIAAVR
jgi:hypothetical protein